MTVSNGLIADAHGGARSAENLAPTARSRPVNASKTIYDTLFSEGKRISGRMPKH
jgi:hypothetical protein